MKYPGRVLAWFCGLVGAVQFSGALLTCAIVTSAATIGTSSYLHVNLSYMPFNYYDTAHSAASYGFTNGAGVSSCPSGASVQGCFKTILGQLRAQGVQGVRIFVQLCDSSSTAFPNCGSPYTAVSWNPTQVPSQQTWITNVGNFFQDVANAGIPNVTVTLASSGQMYASIAARVCASGKVMHRLIQVLRLAF